MNWITGIIIAVVMLSFFFWSLSKLVRNTNKLYVELLKIEEDYKISSTKEEFVKLLVRLAKVSRGSNNKVYLKRVRDLKLSISNKLLILK